MNSILSGNKLEKMAEARNSRMHRAMLIISIVAIIFPGFFGVKNVINNEFMTGIANIFCALIALFCFFASLKNKWRSFCRDMLSIALFVQIFATVVASATSLERLFWVFPLMTAIIYINNFRFSMYYSIAISIFGLLIFQFPEAIAIQAFATDISHYHITASFFCMITFSLFFNYHYNNSNGYIEELYKEGIEELAYKDRLTGLANRWSFEKWAEKCLEDCRYSSSLTALVFLDIDNFKKINDSYGHEAGDRVLQHFAQRLQNNIRHDDRLGHEKDYSIARFAGDEFMILLPKLRTPQDLDAILQRISKSFSNGYSVAGAENDITFSIGVAIFQQDSDNLKGLIRCADRAMYDAKRSGKNRFDYYQNVKQKFPTMQNMGDSVTPMRKYN